ncbi:MAG TPA: FkbM family methyltransferase [Acidimicrobiales bacterium]|nr:FkbM family methyltransferase [Acidimicrobiales bacterium]
MKAAVRASRALLRGYEGAPVVLRDIAHNGEARVLQQLRGELGVVFDVGANVGEWTAQALACGASAVHAFEISPATAAGLTKRYENDARVRVNSFGLSSAPGTITIHHYPDHPALTTITDYPHDAQSTAIEAAVSTGDAYMAEAGVDRIDFLKLDVEGAEPQVIEGFAKAFGSGSIGAVQFEYGRVSILTKYLLRDFFEQMTAYGFSVGRIAPNAVEFMAYDMALETFADSNWVAVHRDHPEWVARLA